MTSKDSQYLRLADYGVVKGLVTGEAYEKKPHIEQICRALELLTAGALPDGKRHLLITMPPRHSKTTTVNNWIEWVMGHMPDSRFILTSYSIEIARKSAIEIKRTMSERFYARLFPRAKIKRDRDSVDHQNHFSTTAGGVIYAQGAGGSITGFGAGSLRPGFAGALIIDDPMKSVDRGSAKIRASIVEWYSGTVKVRLNSQNTPIVLIMQRLHPDDLVGYILANEADDWHHVSINALDEDNNALWEERISARDLMRMREIDPFTFYSQYQQTPIQPGGVVFKEKYLCYFTDREEVEKRATVRMIFADTAMKVKQANDYSVFQLWGFEGSKRAYLLDQIRGKWEYPDLVKTARAFAQKHNNGKIPPIFIEDKVSGTSLIQTLRKEGLPVKEWTPKRFGLENEDKLSRANAVLWQMFDERVWIPDASLARWVHDYKAELLSFTNDDTHAHDDQVDATSMAITTWLAIGGGKRGKEEEGLGGVKYL